MTELELGFVIQIMQQSFFKDVEQTVDLTVVDNFIELWDF
jgi:hypothetical protein